MPNTNRPSPNTAAPNPPGLPKSVVEELRETAKLVALHAKQADLAHLMKTRALRNAASYELGSAKASEKAAKVREIVASAKSEWGRGYNNDWISSTYAMLAICDQLAEYVEACNLTGMAVGAIDEFLGLGIALATGMEKDKIASASELVYRKFDEYTYKNPPEALLPKLKPHVEFVDGKLTIDSFKDMCRPNGKPLFPTLKNDPYKPESAIIQAQIDAIRDRVELQVKAGVVLWLEQHGYVPQEEVNAKGKMVPTGVYLDRDHPENPSLRLTKEKFDEIKNGGDHPERSLDSFLENKFEVPFQHTVSYK